MISFNKFLLVQALIICCAFVYALQILLGECAIVYDIDPDILWHNLQYRTWERPSKSYTISACDIDQCIFDIEEKKPRYRQPYSWPSISKVCHLRYRIMWPSIPNTLDIDIRYRRCKSSISNGHSISKSSISNVTLDIDIIEGPTLDIGVARIQMTTLSSIRCNSKTFFVHVEDF